MYRFSGILCICALEMSLLFSLHWNLNRNGAGMTKSIVFTDALLKLIIIFCVFLIENEAAFLFKGSTLLLVAS